MCWRGHGPEHHHDIPVMNGRYIEHRCRRCHLLRVRNYRHPEYPVKRRPLFALNMEEYKRIKRKNGWTDMTVAVFAEISRYTLFDYKRGGHGGVTRHNASRQFAAKISQAMRCDFSQLWSQI